jgi:N-acetylglucosaminyl-diphospho-decaprenol L-rhamnosyltransferase
MPAAIYFITINYHCSDLIQELIAATAALGATNYEFWVVNNSPADAGVAALAGLDRTQVIEAGGNLGFGRACNLALEHLYRHHPDALVWLLNPDARLTPNAIDYVCQCLAADPAIAILGTRIRDLEGRLWFSHGTFNPWLGTLKHRDDGVDCAPQPVATHPTRWVSGCSMVLNLAAFDHCLRFDPQYFLDYEDADLCERYFRQGQRLRVTQAVLVEHQVSAITSRSPRAKFRHATFSKLYFLDRHGTGLALALNLAYAALRPLTYALGRPAMAQGRWAGLFDYLRWRWRRLRGITTPYYPRTSFTIAAPQTAAPEP